jgi:hypothetical protein
MCVYLLGQPHFVKLGATLPPFNNDLIASYIVLWKQCLTNPTIARRLRARLTNATNELSQRKQELSNFVKEEDRLLTLEPENDNWKSNILRNVVDSTIMVRSCKVTKEQLEVELNHLHTAHDQILENVKQLGQEIECMCLVRLE